MDIRERLAPFADGKPKADKAGKLEKSSAAKDADAVDEKGKKVKKVKEKPPKPPKLTREQKKANRKAAAQAEKDEIAASKAKKKEKTAAFRASIVDGYVTDKEGNRLRRYTLPEKILDNKPLAYCLAIGFLAACLLGMYLSTGGSMFAPQ